MRLTAYIQSSKSWSGFKGDLLVALQEIYDSRDFSRGTWDIIGKYCKGEIFIDQGEPFLEKLESLIHWSGERKYMFFMDFILEDNNNMEFLLSDLLTKYIKTYVSASSPNKNYIVGFRDGYYRNLDNLTDLTAQGFITLSPNNAWNEVLTIERLLDSHYLNFQKVTV